ncbi:MAG: sugar nucleotide-binding protein [Proteobacteria bacterium]|nr:sugar nucleotide-binding protein [Pseudomonadota bacterium]
MRVLILGADGLLGQALRQAFRQHDLVSWGRAECDISDYRCLRTIRSANADIVLNAAAWTEADNGLKWMWLR